MNEIVKKDQIQDKPQIAEYTSLPDAIKSKEKNFFMIKKEGGIKELDYQIIQKTLSFLQVNFSQAKNPDFSDIAMQFAADLIMTEPTWKMSDLNAMFTLIRTKPELFDRKFLKEINCLVLTEWKKIYLDHKWELADAERQRRKDAEKRSYENMVIANPRMIKEIKKILKKLPEKKPEKQSLEFKQPEKPKRFDPVGNEEHYEQFLEIIKEVNPETKNRYYKLIEESNPTTEKQADRITYLLNLLK